jgi:hypothetical protein
MRGAPGVIVTAAVVVTATVAVTGTVVEAVLVLPSDDSPRPLRARAALAAPPDIKVSAGHVPDLVAQGLQLADLFPQGTHVSRTRPGGHVDGNPPALSLDCRCVLLDSRAGSVVIKQVQ